VWLEAGLEQGDDGWKIKTLRTVEPPGSGKSRDRELP
jgi:hypothetical protein